MRLILDRSERLSGRRREYRVLDDAELLLTIYGARPDAPGEARDRA